MESTASINSQPTHEIESKIRVMVDAWNRNKHYVIADSQIIIEN
jgi:hypothetical protein